MDNYKPDLGGLVNSSGFPFQTSVEHQIRESYNAQTQPWAFLVREHPWKHRATGESGYVDLIAEAGIHKLIIECKRTREADWAFLVPKDNKAPVTRVRSRWMKAEDTPRGGNFDFQWLPQSYQSAFCVVRGKGESDTPMLENLANTLLTSIEALTDQDFLISRTTQWRNLAVYVPAIVTTARLSVCIYDPGRVSLTSGEVDVNDATFESVPFVRFRKSLSDTFRTDVSFANLQDLYADSERTVLVISAPTLITVLAKMECKRDPYSSGKFPWETL